MAHLFTVLTQNMSINNGQVERRYQDLGELLLDERPDLIAVQEVSHDVGLPFLSQLTQQLGDEYSLHAASAYPQQEDQQGLVVISRLTVERQEVVDLKQKGNQIQLIELVFAGQRIVVCNMHLEAAPGLEGRRMVKFRYLAHHLRQHYKDWGQVVVGDANSLPLSPGLVAFRRRYGFRSAYKAVHGKEADYTFPAMTAAELAEGQYVKPAELRLLRQVARLPGIRSADGLPRYTTDYILTNKAVRARQAQAVASSPNNQRSISDHLAIWAELEI